MISAIINHIVSARQESVTIDLCGSRSSSIETIERLKSMSNISTINFVSTKHYGVRDEDTSKVVANFLNTSRNIRRLICDASVNDTVRLLEALVENQRPPGNLESLEFDQLLSSIEIPVLGRYLETNRNLKRLKMTFVGDATTKKLFSVIARSAIVQLEIGVSFSNTILAELGRKLGQSSSISLLKIDLLYRTSDQACDIESFFEGLAKLRCLRRLELRRSSIATAWEDSFLGMLKSSGSITEAALEPKLWAKPSFHDEVTSFCILNRVFGTNLISFEATSLWTHVLAKVRGDDSGRATFLFRLLREKPELLAMSNLSAEVTNANF